MSKQEIYICTGRWCHELGATRIFDRVKHFFNKDTDTVVEKCRCLGYCEQGVNAIKNGRIYHELTEDNVIEKVMNSNGKKRSGEDVDLSDDFLGDI